MVGTALSRLGPPYETFIAVQQKSPGDISGAFVVSALTRSSAPHVLVRIRAMKLS
jgi:hypothetical protein